MHQVDLKNRNLILVLGNGFDLSSSCNTRYSDYYDYLKAMKEYDAIFNLCDDFYKANNQETLNTIGNYMVNNMDIPLWTIYFYCTTLKNKDLKGYWLDVENELRYFLLNELKELVNFMSPYPIEPNDDYLQIIEIMAKVISLRYSSYFEDESNEHEYSKANLSDILFEDLNAFERDLAVYISSYDKSFYINEKAKRLEEIEGCFTTYDTMKICSFNYTQVPGNKEIIYPHGNCTNPIIGIDSVDDNETEISKFFKGNRRLHDESIRTYGDLFGRDKYALVFFGLSFSITDLNDIKAMTNYLDDDYEIYICYKPYPSGDVFYNPRDELIDSFKSLSKQLDKLNIKNDSDFVAAYDTNKIKLLDITPGVDNR